MSFEELPTIKNLKKQVAALEEFLQLGSLLRCCGLDAKEISKLKAKCDEMHQNITELSEYPKKFNEYFSRDGWLAHDSLDFDILKHAVEKYELRGINEATTILLDYYSPEQVERRLWLFIGQEELRIREKFINYALADHRAGRYYSAIPLLLMVIDGAFNDATGKGFHAAGTCLDVWDSLTAADGEIYRVKDIFQRGRKKTCTDSIDLPYRNGILHGMDLGYDNQIVTAKCWCFLFVIRDWLASKKSEADRKRNFAEETKTPTLPEIVDKLEQTNRLKLAIESWKPRIINAEHLEAINTFFVPEDGQPEKVVLTFLALWKKRNFGDMAKMFSPKVIDSLRGYAGEVRKKLDSISFDRYSFIQIIDKAPAITEIDVEVKNAEGNETVECLNFRLIHEDEDGNLIPTNLKGGRWQIVWVRHAKNEAKTHS